MELEGADALPDRRLPARRRADPRDAGVGRAARARRQGEGAAGHRQDDRGEDRRGGQRRRDARADQAQGGRSARGRDLHAACPASARRRRAGIWQELGITTVDGAARRPRTPSSCEATRASGRARRRRSPRRSPSRSAAEGPRRDARSARRCRKLRAVVEVLREHPASVEVSIAGSARRMRETVRDLDIIATATDPPALVDDFCSLPWVVDVAAKGPTKATVVSHDGLRFDLRVVPPESYGNLLQHFTGSKHHNVALREDAVRRGFSISEYSVTVVESGEEHSLRDRGGGVPLPRLRTGSRRSCARTAASSRRRGAASCPRSSSSATCAATCTRTRRGRTARTRSRRWSPRRRRAATPTTRSATTRSGCAATCSRSSPRRSTRSTSRSRRSGSSRGSR